MKRLITALILVALIIGLSIWNLYTLYSIRTELDAELTEMTQRLENNPAETLVEDTKAFQELWLDREKKLVRFIQHTDLEQITWDSARLPYLAKYGDEAELAAEINRIHLQIDHLWETQMPRWRTVF